MQKIILFFLSCLVFCIPNGHAIKAPDAGVADNGDFDGDVRGADGATYLDIQPRIIRDEDNTFGDQTGFETPPPVTDEEKKRDGGHIPPVITNPDDIPPPLTDEEKGHDGGHVPPPTMESGTDTDAQATFAHMFTRFFKKNDPEPMKLEGLSEDDPTTIMDDLDQGGIFPGANTPKNSGGTNVATTNQSSNNKGGKIFPSKTQVGNKPGHKEEAPPPLTPEDLAHDGGHVPPPLSTSNNDDSSSGGSQTGPGTQTGGPGGEGEAGSSGSNSGSNSPPWRDAWKRFNDGEISEAEYRRLSKLRADHEASNPDIKNNFMENLVPQNVRDGSAILSPIDGPSDSSSSNKGGAEGSIMDDVESVIPVA